MNPNELNDKELVKFLNFISIILVVVAIYILVTSFLTAKATGKLNASSTSGATLMVVQASHKETIIGTTKAKVRLVPGNYTLYVSRNRTQSNQTFKIVKGQVTNIDLSVSAPAISTQQSKNNEANNFIKQLPIIGPASQFEISYQYKINNDVAEPIIIITAINQANQNAALQWIKYLGYNPNDFTIMYQTENVSNYHPTN